jgi:hypothetical protein
MVAGGEGVKGNSARMKDAEGGMKILIENPLRWFDYSEIW